MIHKNKDEFVKTLERSAKKKGFLMPLLEKDYYLTLILSRVHELTEGPQFYYYFIVYLFIFTIIDVYY